MVIYLADPESLPHVWGAWKNSGSRRDVPRQKRRIRLKDPQEAAYDDFFGVVRVAGEPTELLIRALQDATAAMARLPEASAEPALGEALDVIGVPAAERPPPEAETDAQWRWMSGHRLFFALTQATVLALQDALAEPRAARLCGPGAEAAGVLLRSSAAALRLTASFSPADYQSVVRPAMEPPQFPATGFSGFWSADHRVLLQRLEAWGRSHRSSCAPDCPVRAGLLGAVDEVHESHIGVCRRFVGSRPSLLGGSDDATATLSKLARRRRRLL
ncbi:hypothetical protein [Streptomyces sp. NPDC049916]|uniref:hypothetical protein n=1 Tax=Streptomyces sp. NPDC049916 TaxID=3155156 RepID=UPI003432F0A2